MIQRTVEDIKEWAPRVLGYRLPEDEEIYVEPGDISFAIEKGGVSFAMLEKLVEFFGTKNIGASTYDVGDHCPTCGTLTDGYNCTRFYIEPEETE